MLTRRDAANLSIQIQRRAATCLEVARKMDDAASVVKNLKPLIGKGGNKRSGTTLIALGVALLVFPDPTISDILGTAFIALGLLKKRMSRIDVRDIYEEIRQISDYIGEANKNLLKDTILYL